MIRVAVMGATGYTGVELVRLLLRHPHVQLVVATSRQYADVPLQRVFPSLAGRIDLVCRDLDAAAVAAQADLVFTALPHQAAMLDVPVLLERGCRVVDLSADFRLKDAAVYAAWYGEHAAPAYLAEAVYGLPELARDQIRTARLVANPGCYPTSAALGLAPLLAGRLVDPDSLVIDSKSGTSGAGRAAKVDALFCEVQEGFKAYGVAAHRHTPEIEQTLGRLAGRPLFISFTPHLLPINRGILSTCYARLLAPCTTPELVRRFEEFYAGEAFVRVHPLGSLPNVAHVRGTNFCDLGVVADERTGRAIVVAVIDNLGKGAAGQAVQNMNLMLGLAETTALEGCAAFP